MAATRFSSKKLFSFADNAVPHLVRDCFIALISPFEELFRAGEVPSDFSLRKSDIPDPGREPAYPAFAEYKRDWIEWIFLEVKTRVQMGVRYYNFLGEAIDSAKKRKARPSAARTPVLLFLRKFRRVGTLPGSKREDPRVTFRTLGVAHVSTEIEPDVLLRGKIERKFASCPVLWIANPMDALSLSGYNTHDDDEASGDYELNRNSTPFLLSPIWSSRQHWRKSAEYLIRASDAIVIANTSKVGGVYEEQRLLHSTKAMGRTFVTNPENLDAQATDIGLVDDLTEKKLRTLTGADATVLEKMAGWGHWAGLESLGYAKRYLTAMYKLWELQLDSGKRMAPGYFSALISAVMALHIFRGDLRVAADAARTLANTILAGRRGTRIGFLRGTGEFHRQDTCALEMLLRTSDWYSENDDLYRFLVGFSTAIPERKT